MRDKGIKEVKEERRILEELDRCRITAYTYIYPSEDEGKVVKALRNVLDGEVRITPVEGGVKKAVVEARGREHVFRIFNQFRSRQVLAAVRKHLMKYSRDDAIVLYLNKQTAYVGVYSICDVGESPLGEIVVEIEVGDAKNIIRYLTRF
jgi:predicted RNA binding protein with dsRBD fold (UPF0201 family)